MKSRTPGSGSHTPGPWRLEGPNFTEDASCGHKNCTEHPRQMTGHDLRSSGEGARWIASIHGEHVRVPLEQAHANARLISAAPDLLHALDCILHRHVEDEFIPMEFWDMAKEAVKKAKGA